MILSQIIMILSVTAAVFLVMGIGGTARSLQWLTREADSGLLKLIIRVLVPCFIFQKVVGNPAFDDASNVYMPPIWGFMAVAIGSGIAYSYARITGSSFGFDNRDKIHSFAVGIGIFNYGFVPIPLVQEIFGERALGVLFLHNVGVELGIWSIGVSLASGGLTKGWWKNVLNPPFFAIVVSLILNGLGWDPYVPKFLSQIIGILASAAIPMMMLLIGATFYDQLVSRKVDQDDSNPWPIYTSAVLLRIIVVPISFMLAALFLPISTELMQVAAIQAAMPGATFPIVLANHYGGDPRTAMRVVIGTTAVGFVTIPLWISMGIAFLDLQSTVLQRNEDQTVAPKLERIERFRVAGISVRTTNRDESLPDRASIPGMYQRFESERIAEQIPSPVNPSKRIAVYADYEKDQSGKYTILLGQQVTNDINVPDELDHVRINAGNFLRFHAEGNMPDAVISTWQEVWRYFEESSEHTRKFDTDFELYDSSTPNQADIFISVE